MVLALYKIFVNAPELLGKPCVGFLAASSLLQIAELGSVRYGLKPIKTIKKTEEGAPLAVVVLLGFLFLYTLFFGSLRYGKPDTLFAEGVMLYAVKIEEQRGDILEIADFSMRLEGACVYAFFVFSMETVVNPTIHNVRKCCQLAAIITTLNIFGFLFGVFDRSGNFIKSLFITQTAA